MRGHPSLGDFLKDTLPQTQPQSSELGPHLRHLEGAQRHPTHRVRSHSGCWSPSLEEEIRSCLFLAPGIAYLAGGSSQVEETTDALKRTSHRPAEAKDTPSMTLLGRTGRTAAPHRFWSWTEVNFLPTSFL